MQSEETVKKYLSDVQSELKTFEALLLKKVTTEPQYTKEVVRLATRVHELQEEERVLSFVLRG